jgi:GT2 family glycosyltransferase
MLVAYRSRGPLAGFLDSLGPDVNVLVVNNSNDEDDLEDIIGPRANVSQIDAGGNLGFSAGANLGASSTGAEYLIFMNPDTVPHAEDLDEMIEVLDASDSVASVGVTGIDTAGGGLLPSVGTVLVHVLGLHRVFPTIGIYCRPRHGHRMDVGWIAGSCLAVRRSDFEAVGGFDERYFVFMSDVELGRQFVLRNRRQVLLGDVTVEHFDGGSSDLPAVWTWEQRGLGWGQYINNTMKGLKRRVVATLLISGFALRGIAYSILRRDVRANEVKTYRRSLMAELRNGAESSG